MIDSASDPEYRPDDEPERPASPAPDSMTNWRRQGPAGSDADLAFWTRLLFPDRRFIATPGLPFLANGPYGNAVPATAADFARREAAAKASPEDHVRLLPAFALADDPRPRVVASLGLPLPLGQQSPNVLVVGRSGAGKTEAVTYPTAIHALEQGWSLVAINVKGRRQTRVLRRLARAFGRLDEFMLIAPRSPDRSLGYNPLANCCDIAHAKRLAEYMVAASGGRARLENGVWAYNQASAYLAFAIEAMSRDLPPTACSLPYLRDVITANGYEAFARRHPRSPALRGFARHANGNNNGETVANTVAECTAFIDELVPFLGTREVDFNAFARDGGILVVEIDGQDVQHLRVVVALILSDLLQSLQDAARRSPLNCLPHKTVVVIDELAAAGPVPDLPSVLHTCRDMKLCFVAGTQSISQIPAVYGGQWENVVNGFHTKIALGGGLDPTTAEYISRATGMGTCIGPTTLAPDEDGGVAELGGWQAFARPLFLSGEIANPRPHPTLGPAATVIPGDGAMSAFQVHLTPAHEHGALARLAAEAALEPLDADRRAKPLKAPRRRFRPDDCPPSRPEPSCDDDDEPRINPGDVPF